MKRWTVASGRSRTETNAGNEHEFSAPPLERLTLIATRLGASNYMRFDSGLNRPILRVVEITFQVNPCQETGGFVARWDDPRGGGITTQGDTLAELQAMVADAVTGYFDAGAVPSCVRLHFAQDPIVAVA